MADLAAVDAGTPQSVSSRWRVCPSLLSSREEEAPRAERTAWTEGGTGKWLGWIDTAWTSSARASLKGWLALALSAQHSVVLYSSAYWYVMCLQRGRKKSGIANHIHDIIITIKTLSALTNSFLPGELLSSQRHVHSLSLLLVERPRGKTLCCCCCCCCWWWWWWWL